MPGALTGGWEDTGAEFRAKMKAEIGVSTFKPRMLGVDGCHQKEGFSLESQREHGPADILLSGLQGCERIHSCCFEPPSLLHFVMAAQETSTLPYRGQHNSR